MRWKQLIGAALLAASSPAPARAADPANLGCTRAEIGDTIFARIAERKAANWELSLNVAIGADSNEYLDARDRCMAKHGWSEAAWRLASAYVKAQIIHDAAVIGLRKRGYDPAQFAAEYAKLDLEDRRVFSATASDEADTRRAAVLLVRILNARGIRVAAGDHLGAYFAGLMMGLATVEFVPEQFRAV